MCLKQINPDLAEELATFHRVHSTGLLIKIKDYIDYWSDSLINTLFILSLTNNIDENIYTFAAHRYATWNADSTSLSIKVQPC